jgi:MATE family multidrug resistance protein
LFSILSVFPVVFSLQFFKQSRITLKLAIPLIIGQLGQMLIGLSDTLMVGRLGVTELAASSFAITLIHVPFMIAIGMTMAVSIRVSQARGAEDPDSARAAVRHGVYITSAMGILTFAGAFALLPFLGLFHQDPAAVKAVPGFFLYIAASMVPGMASMAVKAHADAMNRPWPMFWISLGGVFTDIFFNWVLIFGHLGAPAMGLTGAGLSTLIARTAALAGMVYWCRRDPYLREWSPRRWLRKPEIKALRDLVRTGFPSSMHLLAEMSAFVAATLLIGTIGAASLAAHQVAIQCAATIFMVPLGLSMALTVRMGEAFGAKDFARMRPIVTSGWLLGIAFTVLSATGFVVFNHELAGAFVREARVEQMAASLILVAAAFQFSDAMQIVSAGALRGIDDVKGPAWIAFGAYWVVSIPLGWMLAFPGGWGVTGMWWGITAGLTVTALALGRRIWGRIRKLAVSDIGKCSETVG